MGFLFRHLNLSLQMQISQSRTQKHTAAKKLHWRGENTKHVCYAIGGR
jgi:hypothetical protein